jgi:hypothetical protein
MLGALIGNLNNYPVTEYHLTLHLLRDDLVSIANQSMTYNQNYQEVPIGLYYDSVNSIAYTIVYL